jgi:4-hydroxyphenylpyruvate dioxygenase
VLSEVRLHADGDARLRFVSGLPDDASAFLPGYQAVEAHSPTYGFQRVDHIVSNVDALLPAVEYLMNATGFHEFAEFTADDVGTPLSGLNSMVLGNNNEHVLLPINEPTSGGLRKSQIQTYLDQHRGPGVQHVALKTNDIFSTIRMMRAAHELGGRFELMERPRAAYYRELRARLGEDAGGIAFISADQVVQCEALGNNHHHQHPSPSRPPPPTPNLTPPPHNYNRHPRRS